MANAVLICAICTSLPVNWDLSTFMASFYSSSYPRTLMLFTEIKLLGIRCLPFYQGRKWGPLGAILQILSCGPVILLMVLMVYITTFWTGFLISKWTMNAIVRYVNIHPQNPVYNKYSFLSPKVTQAKHLLQIPL